MQKFKLGLLVSFILSLSQICHAEKIYSWKDESGKMHFTNNPALVPLEIDDGRVINMKNAPASSIKKTVNGAEVWHKQCAHCHMLNRDGGDGLRGLTHLFDAINDPSTTPTLDIKILNEAIDDNMDDLATINLTDEEVKAVATYIRTQILKKDKTSQAKQTPSRP